MNDAQKSEILAESVKQLAGDDRFQAFMDGIKELKEAAINAATADSTLDSHGATASYLGEIRAYLLIENLVNENKDKVSVQWDVGAL
jgi:hypothetical protein